MNIEQEIWDDFKEFSEQDIHERISYKKAKSIFGIKHEETISTINRVNGNQYIQDNIDKKIDEALLSNQEIKWDEILKLYPQHIPTKLPKGAVYPKAKFRTHRERREIGNVLLENWEGNRQKLHSIFPNEEAATEYLIGKRWEEKPICPYCGSDKIYLVCRKTQPYKCANKSCWGKFSEKVGTIFQNSKLPLIKWYEGIYLLTSIKTHKISTPQLAKALNLTQKTAWAMSHKIQSKVTDQFITKIKLGLFEK